MIYIQFDEFSQNKHTDVNTTQLKKYRTSPVSQKPCSCPSLSLFIAPKCNIILTFNIAD